MAPPATITLFNIVRDTAGVGIANARVQIVLDYNAVTVTATGDSIDEVQQTTTTDGTGRWAFTIVCNDLLSPANTTYTVIEPHRSYQVAPQSANGSSQQATAANVIVNVPTALATATSNITGNLTIAGTLGVTGLLSANGGLTVTGVLSIPAGGFSMAGPLTLTAAASRIVPGATSLSLRDTANANDNLIVSNGGGVTVRGGLTVGIGITVTAGGITVSTNNVAITAGALQFFATTSKIIQGATSLSVRDNTDTNDNLLVSNAGALTVRNGFTLTAGNAIITAGDLTLTAGELIFADAVTQIIPGATSLSLRNNAASADNLLLTDAGLATFRNGLLVPAAAAGALAANSAYATVQIKIDDQILAAPATTITFTNPLPTNFRHLRIEWYARGDTAAGFTGVQMRFNNISTATYDSLQVFNSSATVAAANEVLGSTSMQVGTMPANTATANYFGTGEIKIMHYQGTVGNKLAIADCAESFDNSTTDILRHSFTGKWRTTATAVTRVDIIAAAGNFVVGSVFTLWGIP